MRTTLGSSDRRRARVRSAACKLVATHGPNMGRSAGCCDSCYQRHRYRFNHAQHSARCNIVSKTTLSQSTMKAFDLLLSMSQNRNNNNNNNRRSKFLSDCNIDRNLRPTAIPPIGQRPAKLARKTCCPTGRASHHGKMPESFVKSSTVWYLLHPD